MDFNLPEALTTINPSISKVDWPTAFKNPFFEYRLTAQIDDLTGEGQGVSCGDENLSLQRALIEAIERIVSNKNGLPSTNGVAGHFDKNTAQLNAVREYFERFAFLIQFYSGKISGQEVELSKLIMEYQKTYSHLKFSNRLIAKGQYRNEPLNVVLSLCRIYQSYFIDGIIIGLGCHSDVEKAKEKAEFEVIRMANGFLEKIDSEMDILKFSSLSKPSFEDHSRLALSPSYYYQIEKTLFGSDGSSNVPVLNINIETEKLKTPGTVEKLGLHFYRAYSSDGIDLFAGKPEGEAIQQILNSSQKFNFSVNKRLVEFPHPIA